MRAHLLGSWQPRHHQGSAIRSGGIAAWFVWIAIFALPAVAAFYTPWAVMFVGTMMFVAARTLLRFGWSPSSPVFVTLAVAMAAAVLEGWLVAISLLPMTTQATASGTGHKILERRIAQ